MQNLEACARTPVRSVGKYAYLGVEGEHNGGPDLRDHSRVRAHPAKTQGLVPWWFAPYTTQYRGHPAAPCSHI